MQVDVAESAEVEHMVGTTVETFGRVDVLFNNAGVNFPAAVVDITEEAWQRTLRRQSQGCDARLPSRHFGDAESRRRIDHQHRVDAGSRRFAPAGSLVGGEGSGGDVAPAGGHRLRAAEHPRSTASARARSIPR